MARFRNGLARVGDHYQFQVKVAGKVHRGTTGKSSYADARVWLEEHRVYSRFSRRLR